MLYLTWPISPMLYSTTRGTSGDMESDTWLAKHDAFVNMFRYLQAKVRVTGSCISMITASSSLSTFAVWASLMLPVPMSPAAENLTPSLVQLITLAQTANVDKEEENL